MALTPSVSVLGAKRERARLEAGYPKKSAGVEHPRARSLFIAHSSRRSGKIAPPRLATTPWTEKHEPE